MRIFVAPAAEKNLAAIVKAVERKPNNQLIFESRHQPPKIQGNL
jgi:hypothetical protein